MKLGQRLLYFTTSDLWLSEEDKDWHYPLLVTLRVKLRKTGEAGHQRLGKHGGGSKKERKAADNPEHNRLFLVEDPVLGYTMAGSGWRLGFFPVARGRRHRCHA